MKYKKINLIAIAGGSASGKTTVAEKIAEACNKKNVIFVQMDNLEWQPFLGLFFGRHLFLIINWS
ncbi:zeta toxin family protein [Spiroplasma endosymbiont of Panzeria rudis]|uniref:zeta toxin family protein n=1 Tax=Spiroplasma endosymbiont of Panzeria rudis TaxID=3066301 RepID=UPI0030D15FAF